MTLLALIGAAIATAQSLAQSPIDAFLNERAEDAFRRRVVSADRRTGIRDTILKQIGGLPQLKTALNPRITGGFTRKGYRVENLIFESQPRFHVTANVYVPLDARPPFPAVLGVAGHSANGKASATYQHAWISLARRGFLVLAFDPPGQGERSETFDTATGEPRAPIGTGEHGLVGLQCLLAGSHMARYEIWDGVRAIDYLSTRPDVDPVRIAVAGNSGGGTQAAYLAAVEPRLAAIVSSCYMTSWRELWYKPGPQDAEQVFPGFLRDGLDFGDFALAAAPKPFLMTTAIQDYFPIDGARRTYDEIKRMYASLDVEAKAGYFEYNDTHGWSKPRREAAYRWLAKWLQGRDDTEAEAEVVTEPEQSLYATESGQVRASLGGETAQSLNAAEARRVYEARAKLEPATVIRRLGYQALPRALVQPVYYSPGEGRWPAVLALNATPADVADMKAAGQLVADLRFASSDPRPNQASNRAMLLGYTLVGLQLSDAMRALESLARRPDVDASRIRIYGRGNAGVVALHAAYLTPSVRSVAVEAMPLSYLAVTQAPLHRGLADIVIPGVLKDYDLPDLARAIAPRPVWVVDARSPSGALLFVKSVASAYPSAHTAYRPEGWTFRKVYVDWLSQ